MRTSTAASTSTCSGLMYAGVPATSARCSPRPAAMPKSSTRGVPSAVTRMLSGFRSRCTRPRRCAWCTASLTRANSSTRARKLNAWRVTKEVSDSPSTVHAPHAADADALEHFVFADDRGRRRVGRREPRTAHRLVQEVAREGRLACPGAKYFGPAVDRQHLRQPTARATPRAQTAGAHRPGRTTPSGGRAGWGCSSGR